MSKFKISLLILMILILLVPVIYLGTSEPSSCKSCHYVFPYVTSWEEGEHQQVKCQFCHESRGIIGKIDSSLRGINHLQQHVTGNFTTGIKGWIDERNCIACHLNDVKQYTNVNDLKTIPGHIDYILNNQSCLECHLEVGHELNLNIKIETGRQ